MTVNHFEKLTGTFSYQLFNVQFPLVLLLTVWITNVGYRCITRTVYNSRKTFQVFIKHEKAKYRKFLSEVCLINEDDEYELHHEFSGTLIEKSEEYISVVVEYIQQHGNPFDISKPRELINLTNRSKIDKEDANFLLNFR